MRVNRSDNELAAKICVTLLSFSVLHSALVCSIEDELST